MTRRILALATLAAILLGTVAAVPVTMGAGPFAVPALRPDGPITLPSGRVLPLRPGWLRESSVQAEMWAAHANDQYRFAPGDRPRARTTVNGTLGAAPLGAGQIVPLAPAQQAVAGTQLAASSSLPNGLRKEVLGFLPYWLLDAASLQWMQYQLLTTVAYFGVAARADGSLATSSGGATTPGWSGWNSSAMTGVINAAHARGVRVVLTVTMMAWNGGGDQAALLGSATARQALAEAIIAAVRDRAADGVNLDFEPVATRLRDQYTSFVRQLKAALVSAGVGSYLTVDASGGAATWASGYDLGGLSAAGAADAIFVMGYDYSWSGSSRAGAVAPMDSPYILDVGDSVDDYLALVAPERIIWGVPYYGRSWQTTSGDPNAPTVSGASGASKAYSYTAAKSVAATHGRRWDDVGRAPWFAYFDAAAGSWVEGYYDDATSLAAKYDMVNQRGLAGTGMWTLLMDQGDNALWGLLANKFLNDTSPPTGGIQVLPEQSDEAAIRVDWKAVDVGSGVASYTVQVRDRAKPAWESWLTGTTRTYGYYVGVPGHSYLFRVAALDTKGNLQPWLPAGGPAGPTLAVGAHATVATDLLNVRAGAGTGFAVLDQLTTGAVVAVLAGPIPAGGYDWYQVQFGFAEWPSSDYPRLGWVAAASTAGDAYLVPSKPPNATLLAPTITGYGVDGQAMSPNGDGQADTAVVSFSLPSAASSARLDVLSAAGQVVQSQELGLMTAGVNAASWDGVLASGGSATGGTYLLRLTVVGATGTHVAPASGTDPGLLARWGVAVDLSAPTATLSPTGTGFAGAAIPSAAFDEAVTGVGDGSFRLADASNGAAIDGAVAYDAASHRATFVPTVPLTAGRTYRAILDSTIRDLAGNRLAAVSWTFTTTTTTAIYAPPRTLTFLPGSFVGYRFDASGHVTASKSATLPRTSTAPTDRREGVMPGQSGAWFRVTAGIWAGYWVRESPSVYLPGIASQTAFSPVRSIAFAAGTYTGYRFDAAGRVIGSKPATLPRASGASAGSRAIINGRAYLAITNGIWAGYWVGESSSVVLS